MSVSPIRRLSKEQALAQFRAQPELTPTISAAARHWHVSRRTAARWLAEASPAPAGTRGTPEAAHVQAGHAQDRAHVQSVLITFSQEEFECACGAAAIEGMRLVEWLREITFEAMDKTVEQGPFNLKVRKETRLMLEKWDAEELDCFS